MADTQEVQQQDNQGVDAYKLLEDISGPTKTQIEAWKSATCNGRVYIFSPDTTFKRIFIMKGLSSKEWDSAQQDLPQNISPEKFEAALQAAIVVRGCLWSSGTKGLITDDMLKNAGAGLTFALYEIVARLSDFVAPAMMDRLGADL